MGAHFSGMPITRHLLQLTRKYDESDRFVAVRKLPFLLLGLAPDGVYRADTVTCIAGALLPHRFTLTTRPSRDEPFGGLLSVALSLTSRPVDVIDHPALWSPDFPPAVFRGRPPAITPFTRKR